MKYRTATTRKRQPAHSRRAATLSEVLVSIMILSIGLISLATLFPISILRSMQATQLTNGAILSMNAEADIDAYPELVFDPNGNFNPDSPQFSALAEHFQSPITRNYIVDPLGWNRATTDKNVFGLARDTTNQTDELPRFPGVVWKSGGTTNRDLLDTEAEALSLVTLPDSWVDQEIESTGTWVATTGTAPNQVTGFTIDEGDLTGVAYGGAVESRIVLFDVSGKKSQVRTISNIVGQTVTWNGADNMTVGLARIETKETRYTWLLTVRQSSSGFEAQVEVVVFFRRPDPSPEVEKHYAAAFTGPSGSTPGSRDATITFAVGEEPPLKKGRFILDATNAHWYRIQNITNRTTTGATLRLDRPARATGNSAMVLEGVIDVFPLKPKDNAPLLRLLN